MIDAERSSMSWKVKLRKRNQSPSFQNPLVFFSLCQNYYIQNYYIQNARRLKTKQYLNYCTVYCFPIGPIVDIHINRYSYK